MKKKIRENNYLIDKTLGRYHVELVFPSYMSLNGDLGYYWDLGISVIKKNTYFNLHIGLIFGWFKFAIYER